MLIQTSLHLSHCTLFSVACTTVLPVLKIPTQAAESWLETHLASLPPKGGCSFQAPHPCFCRLHHCPLSLGSCQLTSKLLMLSGGQSHSVSWGMKAECPLWVSCSGSWERTDFRGTGKKHLFPTHSHTECHLQTLDSLHFLLD